MGHYRTYGWRESRATVVNQVADWPETAYLAAHADVRDAVKRGAFASGLDHYVRFGQFEGRLPPPHSAALPHAGGRCCGGTDHWRLLPGRHGLHGARWLRSAGHRRCAPALPADGRRHRSGADGRDQAGRRLAARWNGENRRYASLLARDPQLSAFGDASARYSAVDDLLTLGLITDVVPG